MKTSFIDRQITYDGSQLSPLFAFKNFNIEGESLICFLGPCQVANEHMKDGEDLFAGESIAADQMLHFVLELYEEPLMTMVCLQRLMSSIAIESLNSFGCNNLHRKGDDIYSGDRKLSISIATRGAVSSMIHFALNTKPKGAPVSIICLEELEVSPKDFLNDFLSRFKTEYKDIRRATKKVFSLS